MPQIKPPAIPICQAAVFSTFWAPFDAANLESQCELKPVALEFLVCAIKRKCLHLFSVDCFVLFQNVVINTSI